MLSDTDDSPQSTTRGCLQQMNEIAVHNCNAFQQPALRVDRPGHQAAWREAKLRSAALPTELTLHAVWQNSIKRLVMLCRHLRQRPVSQGRCWAGCCLQR